MFNGYTSTVTLTTLSRVPTIISFTTRTTHHSNTAIPPLGRGCFRLKNSMYLIVVDYFSHYPEVVQLKSTISSSVIKALKAIFSHHGVPSIFMSDNGPLFVSREMKEFADSYSFLYISNKKSTLPSK